MDWNYNTVQTPETAFNAPLEKSTNRLETFDSVTQQIKYELYDYEQAMLELVGDA